jgi:mRNA interferase RelE/StbE
VAYRIEYTPSAAKTLRNYDRVLQRRILAKIEKLSENPRPMGATKLSGHEAYRIRIGDYRIIYAIADEKLLVLVVEIGNRRDVYRDF